MKARSTQGLEPQRKKSEEDVRMTNGQEPSLSDTLLLLEQRNAELAVISSVQQGLVDDLDMQGIYDLVGDRIRDLFDAQVAIIATFNHEDGTEHFHYFFEEEKRVYPKPRPFDKIRQRLINTKKTINVEENTAEAYTMITGESPKAVPGTVFPKSMVFEPLAIGNSVQDT